ncbi:VPA1262 family N-terminal domain-containing protein [Roseburia faecis]|uniref:VPA1262 family N-terminal domain-containing protein n=1 Tax=Roseburia faecis TaxID=301302 RepID=UPI0031B571B6
MDSKNEKQTKVKDTSLSQGTFSSSNTFSIGDNANELWYQNETMVSKTCSCIINQNVQNNEGIFFEKGNDEHRRFLKWLGDTLSKHPCYEIIIIDPYINDTALGKIIRNIQSPHVAYTIFTNDDKERIASIKRLEKPKEILGLSELNVYVLPADTLHDRYIILRCKDTPIPNVYSMTNSLDNEAQKHSSLIVSLNNRLCIAVDEYYSKLITELQKNNNVTNVFEIEKTAAPNASQENNTSQFVEEKPFQPIATKEEYITLCNNDLSGALEQLAYITPGKLYDDCVAHIHKLDNIEDKLATILKHYQSTPYKNAIKLSQRDSYEERQFLSIAQIFTKQMDFKLSLIDSADNFINYYFDYRFFNESWTIKFAVELLCQIAPVKAIDCLNELYQSLLSEDNRVPQPSNTQRLAAMLITNLTDLLCSSKNNKAITKAMLECDVPFLRAIAIAYSCRNFTTSKKVNVPVILRKLCSNLSVKEQLLTLIYAIKELQTRYFRKNGLYEETQKQIDDVIKIFAAIITESNISDVIGNDDLFKTLHTLSTQNVEDVCKIYDTLVKRGVITNTVAGKYLMELVTEPYKNGVENKKSFYDQIKTIKNSLIILSYIHELDTGSFKTVMKRFKNYEFEFTKPLYSATLKEQNYNLWKNHIDFLGCLVYIELWAQKNYQHKLSKAVNEYKMISSNYSKILMKYSSVYQVIVNELSASKL